MSRRDEGELATALEGRALGLAGGNDLERLVRTRFIADGAALHDERDELVVGMLEELIAGEERRQAMRLPGAERSDPRSSRTSATPSDVACTRASSSVSLMTSVSSPPMPTK